MVARADRRRRALFALALARASGPMTLVGFALAALTTLGALALAPAVRASPRALQGLSLGTAWALAWGAGVLVAFAAALHSLRRDREEGIVALLASRGHGVRAYVAARVLSLAGLLFAVVGGGSLAVALATAALARGAAEIGHAAQTALAVVAYAACFSLTVGPIALASLGARSRAGGYLSLLLTLFVPELLAPLTSRLVPEEWAELVSVPQALGVVRAALAPPGIDGLRLVRALAVIVAVAALATLVVRLQVDRAEEVR